jgi:hypothetical protein
MLYEIESEWNVAYTVASCFENERKNEKERRRGRNEKDR